MALTIVRTTKGKSCAIPQAEVERKQYWSGLWSAALGNMPMMTLDRGRGSPHVLAVLLGYSTHSPNGNPTAGNRIYNLINNGSMPRDPEMQRRLKVLAGPNGVTMAKAMAIANDIDLSRWKYWPSK